MGFPKQKIKLLGFLDKNILAISSFDIFGFDSVILNEKLIKIGRILDLLGPSNSPFYYIELEKDIVVRSCDPLFTEEERFLFHDSEDSEASKTSEEL